MPSGAAYTSSKSPARSCAARRARSSGSTEEFRNVARIPTSPMASTWSFMSEISGDTTSVTPPIRRAGI